MIGFLAGLAVGAVLTVLGAGGSLFIVPVLVFVLNVPVAQATGTSLAIVGAAAAAGAIGHGRKGNIMWRVAVLFGATAAIGAYFGSSLHSYVSDRTLTILFAVILVVAAARMLLGKPVDPSTTEPAKVHVLIPLGGAIGVLSGFLGVGGGFLMVPSLNGPARLTVKQAIGTSLAVIAVSSLSGTIGHAMHGTLSFGVVASVGGGAVLGALAATPLSGRLPERPLRVGFAFLAIAVALVLVLVQR